MGNAGVPSVLILYVLLSFEQKLPFGAAAQSNSRCNLSDREALIKFKEGLIDKSNRLSSWTGDDCCTWEGVGCSNVTTRVVKLDLHNSFPFDPSRYPDDINYTEEYSRSCLGGQLKPSLLELPQLQYLDLSMNNFSGIEIPVFFGSFKSLKYLDLGSAGFNGMIPPHLGNLSSLVYLHLGDVPLGWNLGAGYTLSSKSLWWITKLSSLETLDLSGVYLEEARDWLDEVNMLSALQILNLAGCHLNAFPPLTPDNFTALTSLDLRGNSFISTIPLWMFNLTSLTDLRLAGNYFHGPIPSIISQLTSLTLLDLFSNGLSDVLPNSLCNLSSLAYLHLDFNHFQGSLPNCLGQLTSLTELSLNFNQFSGTLPSGIGQLTKLKRLVIPFNPFTSEISELHFSNLTELKVLRLSSTFLTWNVSSQWIPPFQLQYIDLSSTKVGPTFPSWLQAQKDVKTLMLRNTSISDTLPDWFETVFSQINYLDITHNQITGNLPKFKETDSYNRFLLLYSNKFEGPLNSFPSDVTVYDVSRNSLTGGFPLLEGNKTLSNLKFLTLNDNLLTGNIPEYICNVRTLFFLDVSNNQLSGEIPSCFGNLRHIAMLNLGNNSLSGRIPSSLGNMKLVVFMHLNKNMFHGDIPSSFQNLKRLQVLDIGGNRLEGTIPVWIGNELSNLRVLRFQLNNFFGNITVQLCQLSNLQVLNLAKNKFEGQIPRCFSNFSAMVSNESSYIPFSYLTFRHPSKLSNFMKGRELEYSSELPYLKSLGLSENNLVGEIPEELMNLAGLKSLNLSENRLSGRIPEKIGNMRQLESLDLSINELSGSIPGSLSLLNSLSFLNLSFNELTGPIPSGNQLQTLDNPSIYMGNNGLCGKPLPNLCPDSNESPSGPADDHHTGGIDSELLWFLAGLGPGFTVGFLGICFILVFKKQWRYAYFQFVENAYNRVWVWIALMSLSCRRNFSRQIQRT